MQPVHVMIDRAPETDAERVELLRGALANLLAATRTMVMLHNSGHRHQWSGQTQALVQAERALGVTEPQRPPSLREVAQDIVESIARVQERPTNAVHQFVPRCELERWRENLGRALEQHQ